MTWDAGAPEPVAGLRAALLACPTWVALFPSTGAGQVANATAAIHYPDAEGVDVVGSTPIAILSIDAGRFDIEVVGDLSVAALESLGAALRHELMSIYRSDPGGLVIAQEPNVDRSQETSDFARAAGNTAALLRITGQYGLSL